MPATRRLVALSLMIALLPVLWGAVSAMAAMPALEPVTIQLRWSHQFQFAGYYAALEKGFYAEEGLDVILREAGPGQDWTWNSPANIPGAVPSVILELRVGPEDMGRVIGKGGRTANAMRTLVRVLAAKQGKRVTLEIV